VSSPVISAAALVELPTELPACPAHRDVACPRCYWIDLTSDDLEGVLAVWASAEERGVNLYLPAEALRFWYRHRPPRGWTLVLELRRIRKLAAHLPDIACAAHAREVALWERMIAAAKAWRAP
jgi:hypothetical protein